MCVHILLAATMSPLYDDCKNDSSGGGGGGASASAAAGAAAAPPITFRFAPDGKHIAALNATGQRLALFAYSKHSVTRIMPAAEPGASAQEAQRREICTSKHSLLSGTTTLHIHGREVKVRQSWEGLRDGRDIELPGGTMLEWRAGSGGVEELRDADGTLLARGRKPGVFGGRKGCDLGAYGRACGDEFLLDLVLCSWVCAVVKGGKAEKDADDDEEEVKAMAEVFGALAGVVDG
ncbi:hypothetical protein EJ05DRAFT_8763 [Pseudovirgaria hyperparasitica]|uniref:Uncharacterized protein n=1 Tax=Pseudovirgaria hyperparasitica TaxID=470096 RepID=A0A6A6WKG8_9PEZI|nr:uncharacterized protein EJ05DRAFT_8763 [Pseudovirgaria hyperparasitica]KAF2762658.1 hypothetical protein EJ05DRAFT_8763 [Pseudovirgaria hyperparasitica]